MWCDDLNSRPPYINLPCSEQGISVWRIGRCWQGGYWSADLPDRFRGSSIHDPRHGEVLVQPKIMEQGVNNGEP